MRLATSARPRRRRTAVQRHRRMGVAVIDVTAAVIAIAHAKFAVSPRDGDTVTYPGTKRETRRNCADLRANRNDRVRTTPPAVDGSASLRVGADSSGRSSRRDRDGFDVPALEGDTVRSRRHHCDRAGLVLKFLAGWRYRPRALQLRECNTKFSR